MNAMLEPRMVAAKIHGPLVMAAYKHRPERIAASSQGGLAMLAIRPIVRPTLAALPWDHWLRNCIRLFPEGLEEWNPALLAVRGQKMTGFRFESTFPSPPHFAVRKMAARNLTKCPSF
jgi:hypothetical protein